MKSSTIARNIPGTYEVQTTTRNFTVHSDEPKELGGNNTAPMPMEYLHIALASCVATTLRMYIQRKKWNLGFIEVDVERVEIIDGEPIIRKKIRFEHKPTKEQMKRILNVAEKCPVAKLIEQGIHQETIFL